jgi:hypothetical protein
MQIQKPEINCSTCHKPVALEIAKTDEVGRAVHEECYFLKLGIKRDAARSKVGIKRGDSIKTEYEPL